MINIKYYIHIFIIFALYNFLILNYFVNYFVERGEKKYLYLYL